MKAARLVPLSEAVRILEIGGDDPARWLLRRLVSLRDESGVDLLVRTTRNAKRPRYHVSMARLRRHMPELFDVETEREASRMAADVAFTAVLRRIEKRIETIDDRIDTTEQRLGAIHQAVGSYRLGMGRAR